MTDKNTFIKGYVHRILFITIEYRQFLHLIMSQTELFYKIIPIFSQFSDEIGHLKPESSVNIAFNCTSEELFNSINEKEYRNGTCLLPIGLLNNNQIIDFTVNETLPFSTHESPSPTIYMFRKTNENPYTDDDRQIHQNTSVFHRLSRIHTLNNEENDLAQFYNALKSIYHQDHFKNCIFIHMYKVTDKNISQIITLQNDNDQLTLETIHNAVRNALKQDSIEELIFICNGQEVLNEETLKRTITVINRSSESEYLSNIINLQLYEMLIRLSIYSILFSKSNLINLERFFSYCDQNKSFVFETRELEIALLSLIELFNQQIENQWSHLNYYDLLIPQSKNINLTYHQSILLFGDTLLEYIRTTLLINQNDETIQQKLNEFMPKFVQCLDKTLSQSLVINPKQTEIQTATILCQKTFIYLLKIVFSLILIIGSIIKCSKECWTKFRKKKEINKKVFIDLIIHFCSIILILPIFNIIIYYSLHIESFEANQMEIYWPLLLIISILIILHVYQTSAFHRNTFLNKNILLDTINKAHLNILQIKSTPNYTKPSKYLIQNQHQTHFYEILERNTNDFHPTLLEKSVTESLINSSNNSSNSIQSSIFYNLPFLLLIIIFIPLVTIHPLIPTIYRIIHSNLSLTNILWYIQLIHFSYIILSFIFYTLLVLLMIKSISDYRAILYNLQLLLSSTDLKKQVDFECQFYLNLRREENLEYFIHLFQRIIGNIDKNHILITTMTCTLLIDIILILTAIIRVFVYGRSTDLLTIWCLIDIVILSFFIMLFIIIVVLINKSINYDFIRYLRNLKKDIHTSNIVHKEEYINCDYLDVIIEHMESVTDQYSVKLLGFVVDHSLAIKIFISIITGIASAIASLVQQ
jgi:hypothetical protein